MNAWPRVSFGDVLSLSDRAIPSSELSEVNLAGVYSFGRGLFKRQPMRPAETSYKSYNRLVQDDFVISQPKAWEGALARVTSDFEGWFLSPVFPSFSADTNRLLPAYLEWFCKRKSVWRELQIKSKGMGARRETVSPEQFLSLEIPLPPLEEQRRIVIRLDTIANKAQQVEKHLDAVERDAELLLALRCRDITSNAPLRPIYEVAPVVRRPVEIDIAKHYREIGARSFGKGLFTKPDFDGATATWEKPVWVKSGDLVLSNIKAWEGAIAVASDMHDGCIASHRYITCVPDPTQATANFISYYLLSEDGLEKVGVASPGTADRNRTLSLGNLGKIEVPVPALPIQQSFDRLQAQISALKAEHAAIRAANAALLPATLERMFS